jgi:hypothetical protein
MCPERPKGAGSPIGSRCGVSPILLNDVPEDGEITFMPLIGERLNGTETLVPEGECRVGRRTAAPRRRMRGRRGRSRQALS